VLPRRRTLATRDENAMNALVTNNSGLFFLKSDMKREIVESLIYHSLFVSECPGKDNSGSFNGRIDRPRH